MSRWRKGLIVSAVVIVAALILWAGTNARPRISLTVLRYETNRHPNELYFTRPDMSLYVSALVAVSNATGRDLAYWPTNSDDYQEAVVYVVQPITNSCRKEVDPLPGISHRSNDTLAPSQRFTFWALVPMDMPCKVVVQYSNGRKLSRIW